MKTSKLTGAMAGIAMLVGAQAAIAADSITIAYFTEWAMPFEFAKQQGDFEKAMGVKINWRAFDTGTAISAAMASAGQDLQAVDVAVSYSGNDNCVVSDKLEITGKNAKDLEGKKAAVPIGTAAQYDFLKQMEHFGVDASKIQVVDMAPADGAAALAQGNVDMACGFGGGLQRMEEHGHVLMTGDEKDAIGLHVYDVISAPSEFVGTSPELVTKFLKVVHEMNDKWNSGAAAQTEMLPVIAKDAGMDLPAAKKMMAGFKFLSTADTLGPVWMGGGVQKNLKDVADFFVSTGNVKKALSSYDDRVNAGPLKATSAM